MDQGKVSSVFYTCIVPMLNPLIYSLWNKDVKFVLKKILKRKMYIEIESIAWCHRRHLVCWAMQCVRYIVQILVNLLILLYITHISKILLATSLNIHYNDYIRKNTIIEFFKSWKLKELTFIFNNNVSRKNNNAYDDYGENHSNAYYQDLWNMKHYAQYFKWISLFTIFLEDKF